MALPANGELAGVAWLKTVPGLGPTMVATRLPADQSTWAANGFVVVGPPIGGSIDPDTLWRSQVHQVDMYATRPGVDTPPWDVTSTLAEYVVRASLNYSLFGLIIPTKAGYEAARITGASVVGGPRRMLGESSLAWYQLELQLFWIAVPAA